jgi:hypothetical protein
MNNEEQKKAVAELVQRLFAARRLAEKLHELWKEEEEDREPIDADRSYDLMMGRFALAKYMNMDIDDSRWDHSSGDACDWQKVVAPKAVKS